ncbi:Maltase A3-like [Homarus americanus]|uniref:alpha-glucosidase n=1 Tax=Homarus americanus TaxID=6706 RepID=A0A8J5JN66_HOMAM|nr:Maltase A3-like [Homarus americanus]
MASNGVLCVSLFFLCCGSLNLFRYVSTPHDDTTKISDEGDGSLPYKRYQEIFQTSKRSGERYKEDLSTKGAPEEGNQHMPQDLPQDLLHHADDTPDDDLYSYHQQQTQNPEYGYHDFEPEDESLHTTFVFWRNDVCKSTTHTAREEEEEEEEEVTKDIGEEEVTKNGEDEMAADGEKEVLEEETGDEGGEEEDKKLAWWQRNIVYHLYPYSFQDTDGSGIGDLKGIAMRADYLQQLGVATVWLSPIFTSPMADFGYDISNFTDIDPIFGNMQDFDFLLQEFHAREVSGDFLLMEFLARVSGDFLLMEFLARDLKVVLDLVPNHTSNQHEWFTKSVLREDPYTDYYVWADPKGYTPSGTPIPPNNWLCLFRGTVWQWVEERQQFYLHKYLTEQPDLNYRNPAVRRSILEVMKFWLDRGVDGFRIDAIKQLYEVEDLYQDEAVDQDSGLTDSLLYKYLTHNLTINQPEIFQVALKEFLIAQLYDPDISEIMKYYGTSSAPLSHFPFNFRFIQYLKTRDDVTGHTLLAYITEWLDNMPAGMWPNWVLSNHGNSRLASRVGGDLVDALHMMTMLLPGTPITYYGDELGALPGMEDIYVKWEETRDPSGKNLGPERYLEASRDRCRSPMQWDDSHNAGTTHLGLT